MESITEKLRLLKIDELKTILRGRSLPSNGNKEELIERILKNPRKKEVLALASELVKYGPPIKVLGKGSYGDVTLHKTNDGMLYAIKTLRFLDPEVDYGLSTTTIREVSVFKRMNHPNVLKLIDYGISKNFDTLQIVSEYMSNGELHNYVKTLPTKNKNKELRGLVYQMLCGVAYMHSLDVLHRDLKPQNILVNKNKELKIADFGLARVLSCVSPGAKTRLVTTLWYRPPELLYGGRADQYGLSLDMWACGGIIFEILTGMVLFPGKDEQDMRDKIAITLGDPTDVIWPGITSYPEYILNNLSGYSDESFELRSHIFDVFKDNQKTDAWFNLVMGLIKYDPNKRLTANQALNLTLFDPIRNKKLESNVPPGACLKNLYLVENPINFTIDATIKTKTSAKMVVMKHALVDWLLSLTLKLRILKRTYYMALYIHDFLDINDYLNVSDFVTKLKYDYELFGISCLYIAASYNEVEPQDPDDYVNATGKIYTRNNIIEMCTKILRKLDFKLVFSTCYDFNVVYGEFYNSKVEKLSRGLLFFLALLPEKLYQTKPDQVALLSIMMACLYYNEKFKHHKQIEYNNLIKNMNFCIDLVLDNKFKTAEIMFKSDKYHYAPVPGMTIKEVLNSICKKKLII